MTREELASEVAGRTGLSRREAAAALEAILDAVEESLCAGEPVYLRGFGCFEPRAGRRRRARDPRGGGGLLDIPSAVRPVFRPYDRLRRAVSEALARRVRTAFFHPGAPGTASVSVCGTFNGWDTGACPMQRLPDASWVAEVELPAGQVIRYMFCIDGRLVPDPDATVPRDDEGRSLRSL